MVEGSLPPPASFHLDGLLVQTQPPLSSGDPGPFEQNGVLTCGAGPSGFVGGYSPAEATDPAVTSLATVRFALKSPYDEVFNVRSDIALVQIAFSTWLNQSKSEDITICNEDNYHTTENHVKQACSQVFFP